MRSNLKYRLEALEIVSQPRKKKVIIISVVPPLNFWEAESLEVNRTHIVKREGDFKDYQTFIDLIEKGKKLAKELAEKYNLYIVFMGLKMVNGAKQYTKHSFNGPIPKELKNTHLCEGYNSID